MIEVFDVVLEGIIGILATVVAMMIYKNKGKLNVFATGFSLIAIATIFDVIDEFIDHILLDIGGKGFFILGIIALIWVFKKKN
jgi:hypothetical protein